MPPKAEVSSEYWRLRNGLLWVDGTAVDVIQAPEPEHRILRYELSDYEWTAIKPMLQKMLQNKPRGVWRVNEHRGLNGIF